SRRTWPATGSPSAPASRPTGILRGRPTWWSRHDGTPGYRLARIPPGGRPAPARRAAGVVVQRQGACLPRAAGGRPAAPPRRPAVAGASPGPDPHPGAQEGRRRVAGRLLLLA